jgi:CheY-like chemotaxis protein
MNEESKQKQKILIVDDDRFLLDMYALKFTESGFDVNAAFGSVEAMNKLKDGFTPDAILLDIVMPTMDGFEFLERRNNDRLAPNAKVIILSNLGQQSDIERGKALGAIGYIVKASATPSEVVKQVVDFLSKAS